MEVKDWIILIAPIVVNGIVLFLFQQLYLKKEKKNDKRIEYNQEVLKEFSDLLGNLYSKLMDISKLDNELSGHKYHFCEIWNPLHDMFDELFRFIKVHPVILKNFNSKISECLEIWNSINNGLQDDRKNNNNQITYLTFIKLENGANEMIRIVGECMENCEEKMLK